MSGPEENVHGDFEIPLVVKHDLVYCQQALANHIHVHQKIAMTSTQLNIPDFRLKKSLHQMEEEIMSIGAEQKAIFNRLRLIIDCYLVRNNGDRKQLTDYVSEQISMYATVCGPNIRPMSVTQRLSTTELMHKFISNNSTPVMDDDSVILLDDNDTRDGRDANTETEVMEVMVAPEDIPVQIVSNEPQKKIQPKQESLLKPKAERVSVPNDQPVTSETARRKPSTSTTSREAINLSRLKLKQALCKAKDEQKPAEEVRKKSVSPNPVQYVTVESNPITISSSASSSSSEDIFETVDWTNDNAGPTTLDKEPFLRYFGLYTHPHREYLIKKRSVRKRRTCTSTEHRDFHYGRLDLFEKQYANKRNKRQFLYSPPATRAKKQRRTASDIDGAQASATTEKTAIGQSTTSNASSTTSLPSSSNGASTAPVTKVCVKCFKRNNLLECKICMGKYHSACHIGLAATPSLLDICPCCWRQQTRRQLQTQPTNGQRKKPVFPVHGRRHIIKIN